MSDYYLNEDGVGRFLLEDGSGLLLLEQQGLPTGPAGGYTEGVERKMRRLGPIKGVPTDRFGLKVRKAERIRQKEKVLEATWQDEEEMLLILIAIAAFDD